jgi:hypothetical protein
MTEDQRPPITGGGAEALARKLAPTIGFSPVRTGGVMDSAIEAAVDVGRRPEHKPMQQDEAGYKRRLESRAKEIQAEREELEGAVERYRRAQELASMTEIRDALDDDGTDFYYEEDAG